MARPRRNVGPDQRKLRDFEIARERLENRLKEAREVFNRKPDDNAHPDAAPNLQLEGVSIALEAFHEHAADQGIDPELLDPLTVLAGALADADNGITNALIKRRRRRKGGRPALPQYYQAYMATAAAAVTLLIRAGVSRRDALGKAANRMGVSVATLSAWRDKRNEKGETANRMYQTVLDMAEDKSPKAAAAAAETLINEML